MNPLLVIGASAMIEDHLIAAQVWKSHAPAVWSQVAAFQLSFPYRQWNCHHAP